MTHTNICFIINKAKEACENSNVSVSEHFPDVRKLSKRADNAEVVIKDYKLTRYGGYKDLHNGEKADDIAKRKGGKNS